MDRRRTRRSHRRAPGGNPRLVAEDRALGSVATHDRPHLLPVSDVMIDRTSQSVFDAFVDLTLPKAEWTHEAHLRACWVALQTVPPGSTIDFLRHSIRTYNEATGVANTATTGYHETLTRYFVRAVASLDARSITEVLDSPRCQTSAPLNHWNRTTLFGRRARAEWVPPDRVPLSW